MTHNAYFRVTRIVNMRLILTANETSRAKQCSSFDMLQCSAGPYLAEVQNSNIGSLSSLCHRAGAKVRHLDLGVYDVWLGIAYSGDLLGCLLYQTSAGRGYDWSTWRKHCSLPTIYKAFSSERGLLQQQLV